MSDCCRLREERQGFVSTHRRSHSVPTQRLIGGLILLQFLLKWGSLLASEVCVFTGHGGELQPHPGSFLSLLTQQSGCFPDLSSERAPLTDRETPALPINFINVRCEWVEGTPPATSNKAFSSSFPLFSQILVLNQLNQGNYPNMQNTVQHTDHLCRSKIAHYTNDNAVSS